MDTIKWCAVVICLAVSAPSRAEEPAASACAALAPAAQSGCLEKLVNAADAKLNEVYRRAVSAIEKSHSEDAVGWKTELKNAEQAWIAFRDADCGALTAYEWGHGTGMGSATESCLLEKTTQRTRELMQRYVERH